MAQVGEGSGFFCLGGVSKDSVFLWMPESSWRILSEQDPTTELTTQCDSGRTAATAQSFATWRGQRSRWGSTRSTKHSWLEKGGTLNESMYSYWKSGDIPASYISLLEGKCILNDQPIDLVNLLIENWPCINRWQGSLNVTHFGGRIKLSCSFFCCW